MSGRYGTHLKDGGSGAENVYDGIIDTKNGDEYICDWHYIVGLLNQYDEMIDCLRLDNDKQKELLVLQSEKIRKLEELLMLRRLESSILEKYGDVELP